MYGFELSACKTCLSILMAIGLVVIIRLAIVTIATIMMTTLVQMQPKTKQ